jgi:hypothetical protein
MSDTAAPSHPAGPLTGTLARVPLWAAGAALVTGGALADLHVLLLRGHEVGDPEPAQWVGLSTVMQYYLLIPLGLLVYRARRRTALGRLGTVAGALLAVTAATRVVFWIGSLVNVAVTGRDELPASMMVFQSFLYCVYLGLLLLGIAFLRDRGAPRSTGVLVLLVFASTLVSVPGVLTAALALLAADALRTRLRRGLPAPTAEPLRAAG